jgi:alkylation response protein AidB-like acyl-CoA dehydrogenase
MTFRAPVRDIAFALRTAGFDALATSGAFPQADPETVQAVLDAAGAFATQVLAPLNRVGDVERARYEDGGVRAAPGFADAYRAFADGGWTSLSADPAFGGQGLPKALELAVFEMVHAANMAFGLCPMLSQGAVEALTRHGSERQKRLVLPKLVSGQWTGAMDLTEPQAGSDLSGLTTRAEPDGEGGYRLSGQKIYITWGDHDMAENICHMVLARTPDAPPGVKGVSLFLVPKREITADGGLGPPNALRAASIEHKLGIHGSPTCVMLFDGARAELVGGLGAGLSQMFVMMNAARLQVGAEGVGIAERAMQQALAYAQERRQGRSPWSGESPAVLFDLPDVRRTLLLAKAKVAAARGICLTTAIQADLAASAQTASEGAAARARQELLTPIAKAWCTEIGVEVASLALQVHGGAGYIEQTGAAQPYRDARIAPIYEGTNGIQAIDLVGRKLRQDGGAALRDLLEEIRGTARAMAADGGLAPQGATLAAAVEALDAATEWQLAASSADSLVSATPYLMLAGDVVGGWILGRQALAAADSTAPWLQAQAALAEIYMSQVLSRAPGAAAAVMSPPARLAGLTPESLAG